MATDTEKARKSTVRSRVEHVFAQLKDKMGLFIHTIGLARAETKIGMANLAYNMKRLIWLNGGNAAPAWSDEPAQSSEALSQGDRRADTRENVRQNAHMRLLITIRAGYSRCPIVVPSGARGNGSGARRSLAGAAVLVVFDRYEGMDRPAWGPVPPRGLWGAAMLRNVTEGLVADPGLGRPGRSLQTAWHRLLWIGKLSGTQF